MSGEPVPTYCPLCVSRCGALATVDGGKLISLQPDPSHPTGRALCVKGKAAPKIIEHPDRLLHPMRRTQPKGSADPGWEQITWDEALDTIAERLLATKGTYGAEAVAFSSSSPSTTAISDAIDYVERLVHAFGTPNFTSYMELCGWGRFMAPLYTFGAPVPGAYLPDLDNAGCILFWGYNPSVARLAHATATTAAIARGAKLIFVDPRKTGLAAKADHWLRVRPGTDAALALSMIHVLISHGWYDDAFVRDWTNAADVVDGSTVWDLLVAHCADYRPEAAEEITGVPAEQIVDAARTLWESRPAAFYTWSGLEQHSGTTQIMRAINVLYALTGSFDAPGGNVLFDAVPANRINGGELVPPGMPRTEGFAKRPLGPARFGYATGEDFYRAALDGRIKSLVGFGGNMVMAHGDSGRGRSALLNVDFFAQVDLFMTPTAELADIVLPVTFPWESEALKIGFELSQEAQSLVQLRHRLVEPKGEARSDLQIIFDLATRLGIGEHFWGGDIEAGWRHQLEPSGVTLEDLRAHPEGVRVPLQTRHRKYEDAGFNTPSGKVELYSATLADHGYPGLPTFEEPATSPRSRPDLAEQFPLVLSCAKSLFFCETQHRQVASLRKSAPDPIVELHPDAAAARGIAAGDWVSIDTPQGSVRARAKLNTHLDPQVAFGQHGWWEACEELGLPGYPPYGVGSANLNLVLPQTPSDPISGSSPLRASVCNLSRLQE
ncbi:molybdopterin-dependent oxidoreductase [Nocardioides humilatus]|uniref:Molybdopterin-dependent oxidoreductase n=1 Tax=Nocardioides humilatus TaxID=2607660 RepID=A0A5B1LEN0_9ACTN|nr:molybdopterin-dependent oxidoreductase [Nocardioides humilatus]KAA1419163.1 molybdopterin-dependent oxidoreductase [Nocardioides humilatus]